MLTELLLVVATMVKDAHLPPPTKEQIALIQKMGDDDFRTREKASRDLKKMGRKALLALEKYGLKNKDVEIVHRSKNLIQAYYNSEWPEIEGDSFPFIYGAFKLKPFKCPSGKTFTVPKGTARAYYLAQGGSTYEWNDALFYNATQAYVKDLIRLGWQKKDLECLLHKMRENQDRWQCGDMSCDEDDTADRDYQDG